MDIATTMAAVNYFNMVNTWNMLIFFISVLLLFKKKPRQSGVDFILGIYGTGSPYLCTWNRTDLLSG